MSEKREEIKRWTAHRKAAVVMDIFKGKSTPADLARRHDLMVAEVERWMDDFVSKGTEALRTHPQAVEAILEAKEKELFARIGELTMQIEAYRIACEVEAKPMPDTRS